MGAVYQNIEQIIAAADPIQKILWNEVLQKFGERIAIRPLCYTGVGVSEFGAYVARKIYIAYQVSTAPQNMSTAYPYQAYYDELNNLMYVESNVAAVWNNTTAAANYLQNSYEIHNIWFSRVNNATNYFRFIGFRITY